MTTILRLTAVLLVWLALVPAKVQAQSEGQPFSCDGTFYQVRQIGTGASAYSALYVVDRSTSTYSTSIYTFGGTNATGSLGVVVNALGYNPQDSYLYAVTYPADNGTPDAATGIHLYRIGKSGIRDLGKTNLPLAQYNSGTIDRNGNYYLTTRQSAGQYLNTFFRLKLSDFSTVLTSHDELPVVNSSNATASVDFTDIAFSPTDNSFYGSSYLEDLFKITVTTVGGVEKAVLTTIKSGTNSVVVGSNFFDIAGNLYTYSNAGGIYSVDTGTGAATLISTVDAAPNSDGASCINPSERIDVIKDLVSVSLVATRTYDVRFNVRVKNTGTTTATNIQVSDFLLANGTFPTATSVTLVAGASVTNTGVNGGAAPTLAFNTAFNGQGTNADLLTGNQPLGAGQSALIDFTVRVVYPTNGVPTTAQFNSAYASSISGTTANQGHIQLSNGDVLPPGNLLAQDQSTNSGAFPITANGDTPSATPVRFQASIQGNVFEDMNYGGGLGRTQTASNGQGVNQARVELYDALGNFLRFTTTDAAGNYEFTQGSGTTALASNTSYRVRVVNGTITSRRPNPYADAVAAVQTYIYNNTNQIGGADPNQTDIGNNTSSIAVAEAVSASTTFQSLVTVTTPAAGPLTGVDFGYNFDTVVNTNNQGQGSLRQFILNSNALTNANLAQEGLTAGKEHAIFMLNDGVANTNGLRSAFTAAGYNATTKVFTITPVTSLAAIFDDNTVIDGKLQSNRTGENVAVTTTSTGPEISIDFGGQTTRGGLVVTGANTRIASLRITRARGTSTSASGSDPAEGASVTFSGSRVAGSIFTDNTSDTNYTAGVRLEEGATGVTVTGNIIRSGVSTPEAAGVIATDAAGIVLNNASGNTISNNTISNNAGYGINFQTPVTGTNDGNTVSGNTMTSNGGGTATFDKAAIAIYKGNNNLFSQNTISASSGDAILAFSGTSGNRFTQNSMFNNGTSRANDGTAKVGIDLVATGYNALINAGDDVTLNSDGKSASSGANGLLNFPVITQAAQDGVNLRITGYAPLNAQIEFFVADMTTNPSFGEGRTYLATRTEGLTGQDADTKSTAYSGVVNGQNSGSEAAARRFAFVIPFSSLTAAQITALTATNARITSTSTIPATVNGLAVGNTSEFSGNAAVTAGVLPVELTTFTAKAVGQDAVLNWATASEKNNDHFVVERSYGEQAFTAIGTVKADGSNTQGRSYRFTDAGIGAKNIGTIYYRLKQVDTDGTVTDAGPVRTLLFTGEKVVDAGVYPNPALDNAQLDLTGLPAGTYQVSVVDATGRTLRTNTYAGGTMHPFVVSNLTQGSYLVVIRGNNVKLTKRLVKN